MSLPSRVSRFFSTRGMRWRRNPCWLWHLWRLLSYIHSWRWLLSNNFASSAYLRQCSLCCFFCWRWTALKILGVPCDHSSVSGSFSCYHASFLLKHSIRNALKWCTELVFLLLTQQHHITFLDGRRFCISPLISINLHFLLYQSVFLSHFMVFFIAKAELRNFATHFSSTKEMGIWTSASHGVWRWPVHSQKIRQRHPPTATFHCCSGNKLLKPSSGILQFFPARKSWSKVGMEEINIRTLGAFRRMTSKKDVTLIFDDQFRISLGWLDD